MRAVAFLLMLSFAGYVSTQYAFQTGKQYTYQVRGRLMTGISKINTQYAGLEVDYKIDLIAVGPNTIVLNPHGFRATEVNAELEGGWRDGELNEEAPVDIKGELREYLESPIELTMRQGVVDSIKVEGNLPTWAVNIKKGQASHFVLDTTGANVVLSGNLNRKTNSVRPEEANQESGFFYETMEDTVHGECETYYTVSQNGPFDAPYPFQQQAQAGQQNENEQNDQQDSQQQSSQEQDSQERQNQQNQAMDSTYNKNYKYGQDQWQKEQSEQSNEQQRQQYFGNQQQQQQYQANNAYQQYAAYKQYAQQADSNSAEDSYETRQGELPWPQAFDKFCNSNDQVYEIVKSVNFTSCKNKPVLSYSTSAQLYGRGGDNSLGSAFERAVITRFLACGKDRKQYTILQIKQEEQVNFGLRLDQKTLAGTVQNVTLLYISKADNLIKLQNPKTIQSLSYTFDPLEQKLQKRGQIQHPYAGEHEDNDSDEEQNQKNKQSDENQDSQEQQLQQQQQQQQQQRQQRKNRRPRSADSQQDSSEEDQNDQNEQNQKNQENEFYQTSAEGKGQLPQPSLTEAPLNPFLISPLRTSGMKKRIQDLMKEIIEDITTDKQSMAEAETLSKITKVSQILRFLGYRDIEQLYYQLADKRQTEEDQTSRYVFLDAVAIAGTNPNIKFLVDLVQKKQLTGEHAAQVIMTFPMYVRTPTQPLLKEIYQLVDSSAVESDKDQVKTAAVLALSNLLYQACVNSRIRNSRYPVATYGQTCDQKTVQRKYAQYFVDNLKKHQEGQEPEDNHWAATYLTALGNLGVPEVIPEVQRILDDETESYIKVKAVLALKHLVVSRQNQNIPTEQFQPVDRQSQDELTDELIENEVLPILVAVSADKGEHPEVRMAALSLLFFTTDADMTIWQQIAYSTWFAGSQEVHAFIYSTLKSLAALERPNSPLHYKMQQKARAVLSLAKPTNAGMLKSRNIFSSKFFEHVQSGFYHHLEYFGAKDSNFPAYLFYKNNVQFGNGAYGANPLEFEAHGDSFQKLANYVLEQFQKETSANEPHPENEQVDRLVGIQDREQQDESNEASFRIKIRSEMERLFSINEQTIQQLIQKAKGQLLPQLYNGLPINYQKTFHMMEQTMEMPSAMGIPITHRFTMAVHFSARGNVKIVQENGFKDIQVQAELHPVYAWKGHGKVSIKSPYTGKKYEAGVQRHMVVEAPFRALVRKAQQGQIVVAFTPSQLTKGNPSGQIDIVTYHQRPYTAIINDEFWPTSHKEGGTQKLVHAVETPYKNERSFGQKALGLHFTIEEETDYRSQNEGPSGWVKFWKRFHSPTCYFNVGWFGAEQVRHAERKLSLDVSKSETKTLAFVAAGKYEEKAEYKELWNDSQSGSSESSEEDSKQSAQQGSQENQSKQQTRGQRRNQDNQNSNSNENDAQDGQVVAVALIGKRAPIKSSEEQRGIQKLLVKANPSTVQYIFQASQSSGRVYFRAASGDAANEAADNLPQTSQSLQALRDAVLQPQNAKTQEDGCLEFEGEYEAPKHANSDQLVVLRKVLLQDDLSVKVKGEAQFGKSCKNMQHEIKLQGKLFRGPKMTEWAQKKSPEAKKCEKDEQQGFSVSPVCLYVSDQQAAALNQAELKITYSKDLPVQFRNSTDDVEDFAKAYLYPYMSHDRFHEGTQNREIRIEAHITPSKDFIDVTLTKPNSRLSFRSIRTNGFVKAFLPLTATQSLAKNVQDRTFRDDSQPFCSVEGNQVNTFDNVTYRFDKEVSSGCYQVLAKDCSGRQPVAVLVKDVTEEKKEVIILLGDQTKIHLSQKQQQNSRLYGKAKLQVKVNDQRAESFPHVIRSKDNQQELIAQIEIMNEGTIQVNSPQFQVATDGKWIYVQAAHSLRNRTCGICGDFDGEKVGEFRGPKDCALSSGSLLIASYSYQSTDAQDKEQCKVQSQAKKQIAHEQSQCQRSAAFYPNQPRMFANKYQPANNQYETQYNSQQQVQVTTASNDCIEKVKSAVRTVVYDIVNTSLKPFVWNSSKRHEYANKVADYVSNKIAEILSNNSTAQAISKAIVTAVCAGLKLVPVAGWIISAVCKVASPLIQKGVILAVNPICQKTQCCTPSQYSFNPTEIAAQLAYAVADESEADPSDVPYIPKRHMPMSCLSMLEENLSQAYSKYAYLLLIADRDMSETERKQVSRDVYRLIREAVESTMKQGGNGRLIEAITQRLDKVSGLQSIRRRFYFIIERLTPFVVRLFNATGCQFPIPRKNQSNNQSNNQNQSNSQESDEQDNQNNSDENDDSSRQSNNYNSRRHHRRHHHKHGSNSNDSQ